MTGGDEVAEEVEVPEIIPILTLRSSVLFPGAITPITVGRDKSISLVRAVNAEGGILGAVLQRESDVEDPAPDDMYKVGTAARIIAPGVSAALFEPRCSAVLVRALCL